MDSLTHALAASVVLSLIGRPELIPFAALGAVAPDVDVIFQRFSRNDPEKYLFTHGGITHSIAGTLAVSMGAASLALAALWLTGHTAFMPLAFAASMAGGLSHVLLDFLAYPGIPLLYPATDRKYTAGIFAGPTPYLLVISLVYAGFLLSGKADLSAPWAYAGLFVLVIGAGIALKAIVARKAGGMAIPGLNPIKWLIIDETPGSYRIYCYHLLAGRTCIEEFPKLRGVSGDDLRSQAGLPEVKRLRYNSYAVTAASDGDFITYSDPVREGGYLWYPPDFKRLRLPARKR